ncbi:hypothetical protein GQ44DRAFT_797555, partial [Phaeosphaeriaceae sp. PMI808]
CLSYVTFLLFSDLSDTNLRTIYHLTKLYESIDVPLVQLTASTPTHQPIDLHFFIHHLTTPYFTYLRALPSPPVSDGWRIFALLNKAHHTLMYAFFGKVWGQENGLGLRVLRVTGVVQLGGGIFGELWMLGERWAREEDGQEGWRNVAAIGLLATWLVLNVRDMRVKDREREVKSNGLGIQQNNLH